MVGTAQRDNADHRSELRRRLPLDDRLWLARLDTGGVRNRFKRTLRGPVGHRHVPPAHSSGRSGSAKPAAGRPEPLSQRASAPGRATPVRHLRLLNALQRRRPSPLLNRTVPVVEAPQLTFPSLQDGASFRMPQETQQTRFEISDTRQHGPRCPTALRVRWRLPADRRRVQPWRVPAGARGGWSRTFPRSTTRETAASTTTTCCLPSRCAAANPTSHCLIPDADNVHLAGFVQDDWTVSNRLQTFSEGCGTRWTPTLTTSATWTISIQSWRPSSTASGSATLNNLAPPPGRDLVAERPDGAARWLRDLLRPGRPADCVAGTRARRPGAAD